MSAGADIYRQLPSTKQRSSSKILRFSQIDDVEKIKNCCTKSNQDLQELHKSNHGSRIRMAGNTTEGNTRKRQACKRYQESSTESPQLKRNRSSANGKGRELRIINAQSPQMKKQRTLENEKRRKKRKDQVRINDCDRCSREYDEK